MSKAEFGCKPSAVYCSTVILNSGRVHTAAVSCLIVHYTHTSSVVERLFGKGGGVPQHALAVSSLHFLLNVSCSSQQGSDDASSAREKKQGSV